MAHKIIMNTTRIKERGVRAMARFDAQSLQARVAFVLGAVGAYVLAFSLLYRLMGPMVSALATLPVLVVGALLGLRAGLLASLLSLPLNVLLYDLIGLRGWDVVIGPQVGSAMFALVLVGAGVGLLRDLSERVRRELAEPKRAEDQIRRQLQRLAALRDVDKAITASLDLRATLNVLLDQVTTQLGIHAADVLLLNWNTQTLECTARRGFRTAALQHTRLRLGEGHAGRAALERRVVSILNLAEAPGGLSHAPLLADEGFVSYYAVPLIVKGQVKGVLEILHRAPLTPDSEWLDFLETLAGQAAIAVDNASLFDDLQRSNAELALAYDTTLEGWSRALDLRDKETEGHTQRVTEMTLRLASAMGMSEADTSTPIPSRRDEIGLSTSLVHVRRGALLHDIGKMGIPDSILHKPGPLTEEEWEIMRRHPVYAYEMLSHIAYLRPALDIPYCHHERWDGTGYPRGLRGEQIPLAARIFTVADVWDALRSDRPYRPLWPEEKVRAYIREQAGKQFDPQVVEVFLEMDL